ncbi:MAG TPA: HD domain-containing protein [Terracidiphilus sp.]|nr:HD domain-containing protein [Terracidiphilus sp.]
MNGWRDSVMAYVRAEAKPVDKFGHMPRLYALASTLGQGMDHDDDVLFAAAWLHDLGVFLGHRPQVPEELARWDHVPYTVSRMRELLPGWGFPAGKLDAVAETIQTHQPHDHPSRIEGILLRDADILEQLGAIGLLRAVAKIGRDSRYPTFSSVLPVLRDAANTLPGKLHLIQSRSLAEPRVEILRKVISSLENEAGALLF